MSATAGVREPGAPGRGCMMRMDTDEMHAKEQAMRQHAGGDRTTLAGPRSASRALLVAAGLAMGLCAQATHAQNALDRNMRSNIENPYRLGAGTGLERRLEITAPVNRGEAATRVRTQFALRNAIVTGNAPGGASFRGDVGYAAPFEFRGELGSDDLFAFRRDSLYSGLAGRGIRGLEGLQYQFSLTTGVGQPNLVGNPIVERGFAATSAADVLSRQPGAAQALDDSRVNRPNPYERDLFMQEQERLERATGNVSGGMLGTLRSSAAYRVNMATTPSILGTAELESGERYGLTASGLSGVRYVPLVDETGRLVRDQQAAATGARPAGASQGLSETTAQSGATRATPTPAVRSSQSSYSTMLERLSRFDSTRQPGQAQPADPAAPATTPPPVPQWEQDLMELRRQLMEDAQQVAPRSLVPRSIEQLRERREAAEANRAEREADGGEVERERGEGDEGPVPLNDRAVEAIRQAGGPVPELLRGDAAAGAFRRQIEAAGDLMARGRYFDAEERYTRALAAVPGDPVASIGRVHAQLGAGLHVSAAMNLRDTLRGAPELVGVQHPPEFLPQPDRLAALKADFERTIEREEVGGALAPGEAREASLMLAYLAFQTQDRALLERSLRVARRQAVPGDERLLELLERVWLGGEDAAQDPPQEREQPDAGDGG